MGKKLGYGNERLKVFELRLQNGAFSVEYPGLVGIRENWVGEM